MTHDEVIQYVESDLEGTLVVVASEENGAPEVAWGDTFFIYDPDRAIPPEKHFPYATVVINDYPGFDEYSNLARPGVFRVNVWVGRGTFDAQTVAGDQPVDHSVFDRVTPHPVYASQGWLSIVNPGPETDATVKELLAEAHERARARYEKRQVRGAP
jgi:hypothetical protein